MAVAEAAVTSVKAGFWIRVLAYIVDSVALFAISFVLGLAVGFTAAAIGGDPQGAGAANIATLIGYVIALVYFPYFWSHAGNGRTVGMRLFGLKVVRTDGSDLTATQAVIRLVGWFVASLPLLIGLIWVAFDKDKQGWHDKIASTYVIKA